MTKDNGLDALAEDLRAAAKHALDLSLDQAVARRLVRWLDEVSLLSREINLIAELPLEVGIKRHILDSLALAEHFGRAPWPTALTVLDFGTGGGFPGAVLGLMQPGWRVTLADARNKKLLALARLFDPAERGRFEFLHGRFQDLLAADRRLQRRFDLITVRAVGPLAEIIEVVAGAIAPGGALVCWKSQRLDAKERESGARAAAEVGLVVLDERPYEAAFQGLLIRYGRPA